ncbi:MAG: ribosome maturation factor [Bacteroidetes bacterium]|nr:ribosome maturation factor [Bacteroidota bacterium]
MDSEILKDKIKSLVEELLSSEPEYFLVDIKIKPINHIKVFVDGDKGINIEHCVLFNKKLVKLIDAAQILESGDYSLEFSSPGIQEPLKLHRQYVKNTGRNVVVTLMDKTLRSGTLKKVEADTILISRVISKNKKPVIEEDIEIPFNHIVKTIIQVQF